MEVKKEFFQLCGNRDKNLITEKEKMKFFDIERLLYLTEFLGYNDINTEIYNKFIPGFEKELENLEKFSEEDCQNTEMKHDIQEELSCQHEKWVFEFYQNAPDSETKMYLKELINIIYKTRGEEARIR